MHTVSFANNFSVTYIPKPYFKCVFYDYVFCLIFLGSAYSQLDQATSRKYILMYRTKLETLNLILFYIYLEITNIFTNQTHFDQFGPIEQCLLYTLDLN